jgi:hypothetical protein
MSCAQDQQGGKKHAGHHAAHQHEPAVRKTAAYHGRAAEHEDRKKGQDLQHLLVRLMEFHRTRKTGQDRDAVVADGWHKGSPSKK